MPADEATRDDSGMWVVLHTIPPTLIKVPTLVIMEGPEAITRFLQNHGHAVVSAEDWHVSITVPPRP